MDPAGPVSPAGPVAPGSSRYPADGRDRVFTWVTDMTVTKANVWKVIKAGRARWKIENETFKTFEAFAVATILYLAISFAIMALGGFADRRLKLEIR